MRCKKETAENQKAEMGVARLELAETEVDGFTVHCNCHYAKPPEGIGPTIEIHNLFQF